MNQLFSPLFTFLSNLTEFGQSLSKSLNDLIEARITVNKGRWAQLQMKRRFGLAIRQLRRKPLSDVKALIETEFTELSPALQADAIQLITDDLRAK